MRRVLTIGGGTGTFTLLSALKRIPNLSLTAIVSSADDGGSTGRLRDAYGILPPGDARQALVALAEDGDVLRDLFAYRFAKGDVRGHNLGNLFLVALTDLLGSDRAALAECSRILRIQGTVLPASEKAAILIAQFADGTEAEGEGVIDERIPARGHVLNVSYREPVELSSAVSDAITNAGTLVMGPGDLYTSTAAALLVSGMKEAIAASSAQMIYVMNLFTKAGQTTGYSASEHLREAEKYAGRPFDMVIVNKGTFAPEVLARYAEEGEYPVEDDLGEDAKFVRQEVASVHMVPPVPEDPVPRSLARHDSEKLASALAPYLLP
ncbi:MAG: putative gluconeosis factor [Parcubacteria group bacterium]|nr:putative gluconeosis factor [Parcubacteria group bacterium]